MATPCGKQGRKEISNVSSCSGSIVYAYDETFHQTEVGRYCIAVEPGVLWEDVWCSKNGRPTNSIERFVGVCVRVAPPSCVWLTVTTVAGFSKNRNTRINLLYLSIDCFFVVFLGLMQVTTTWLFLRRYPYCNSYVVHVVRNCSGIPLSTTING